jgi:hypothetical protein
MENENIDAQEVVIEQEEEETTDLVDETEEEETPIEDEVTISKAKFSAMQRKAIAYDASKKQTQKPQENINNNNSIQADELKLIARGLSDEEIEQAKVIAKGKGVPLLESIKDPLFISYQTDLKEKERKEKAKLGSSKGSGSVQAEKGFHSGMSREEHYALWKESNK